MAWEETLNKVVDSISSYKNDSLKVSVMLILSSVLLIVFGLNASTATENPVYFYLTIGVFILIIMFSLVVMFV